MKRTRRGSQMGAAAAWALASAALLVASPCLASTEPPSVEQPGLPDGVKSPPADPRSLYRIRPWADGLIIGISALAAGVPFLFMDELIEPRCPCDPAEVSGLDRFAIGNDDVLTDQLSNVAVGTALVVPLAVNALVLDDRHLWLEDAVVFLETVLVTGALTTSAKFLVQRPEPRAYRPARPAFVSRPKSYLSFFSGHTALTFAALTATTFTAGMRHGMWVLPAWVTFGMGSGVAATMVFSGRHFASDVFVGAVVGSVVGIAVPWMHLRQRSFRFLPTIGAKSAGLALVRRF